MSEPSTIPTLQGTRILLRPFSLADAPDVQTLLADPAIAVTTLNIDHPYPDGAAIKWISSHEKNAAEGLALTWAIERLDDHVLLGAIAIHLTPRHARGEIGYWMGVPFWGNGLTTEAAQLVVDFGFASLNLRRIQATCLPSNIGSSRVMEKAGLTFEGILHDYVQKHGVFQDIAIYARTVGNPTSAT